MADTIHNDVAKRALFAQEFKDVVETKNVFSKVATKLVAKAKNIYSPFTSVTAAKAHTTECSTPIATLTIGKDELVLDRKIGNAITDCKEELSYANFNVTDMIRGDLYASVIKRANEYAVTDFVADATVVPSTRDLSTADLVREFLIEVANANTQTVGVRTQIDGATVKRCEKHGQAFVAAGNTAYVNIVSKVSSIVSQSSLKGIEGKMVETPFGVTVINLGTAADNAKRLIWGTAGVPVMGYREDTINVDMGEIVSTGTAGADDLDVTSGDAMLNKTWYILAETKGKNGIFSDNATLVSTQLMA